jgi:hypothetical protein
VCKRVGEFLDARLMHLYNVYLATLELIMSRRMKLMGEGSFFFEKMGEGSLGEWERFPSPWNWFGLKKT